MAGNGQRTIFADASAKLGALAAIPALVVYFFFKHFGYSGKGKVAGFSLLVLLVVTAMCRPLWKRPFLWPSLFLMLALHVAFVFFAPTPDTRYPAILLYPFAAVDFALMLGIISILERKARH